MRAGTQSSARRSVLAWRRSGVSSGACPEAAASGERSQSIAVRLIAAMTAVIQTRLAFGSPEGRRRSAWPSLASLRRSSIWARWPVEVLDVGRGPVCDVGQDEAVAEHRGDLARQRELQLLGMDRLESPRARAVRQLARGEAAAPYDQPQRLVLPALRGVAGFGDLGAVHVDRRPPGVIGDPLERAPHRAGAR